MTRTATRVAALGTTALASALACGVLAAPADAQVRSVSDSRRDVAGKYADITGLRVANGGKALVIKVRQRAVSLRTVSTLVRLAEPGTDVNLFFVGAETTGRGWNPHLEDRNGDDVACAGLKVRKQARTVVIRVPQSCLGGDAGTLRVAASTQRPDGRLVDITDTIRVPRYDVG